MLTYFQDLLLTKDLVFGYVGLPLFYNECSSFFFLLPPTPAHLRAESLCFKPPAGFSFQRHPCIFTNSSNFIASVTIALLSPSFEDHLVSRGDHLY